jgi:hypothetical protein
MDDDYNNYGVFDKTCLTNTSLEEYINKDIELNHFMKTLGRKYINRIYFKIPIIEKDSHNYFTYNDMNVTYDNFQWIPYLSLNGDLRMNGVNTKDAAWSHWIHHGKKEERCFSYINNSNNHRGRLGNIFFINMFLHFISQKFDLKSNYKFNKIFNDLGIIFYSGNIIHNSNLLITEKNYLELLSNPGKSCNVIIDNNVWFHDKIFSHMIKKCIYEEQKNNIISKNLFKSRYQNNNDIFIHVRLGDMKDITEKMYNYYADILKNTNYDKGYITSDSIKNDMCIRLIQEFKLIAICKNEQETIMFGSTCKYVILSGGTFSWMIGLLSFFSEKVYYPDMHNVWYGTKIFHFDNWRGIVI